MASTSFESQTNYSTSYPTHSSSYAEPEIKKMSASSQALSSLSWSEWKEIIYKTLDEYEMKLNQNKYVSNMKQRYLGNKYSITHILFGMLLSAAILTLYMLSGVRALSNIVGVIIPFYMSLKALNVKNGSEMNKNENMLWLSYWIIYGIFTLFESISGILLFWMGNMYELCKMAFYLYLYHPNTKGALFLYRQCLQPFVIQFINYEHTLVHNIHVLQKNLSINEDDIILNDNNNDNNNNNNNNNMNNINKNNYNKDYSMNTNTSANTSKINNYVMPTAPPSLPTITTTGTIPVLQTLQPVAFAATTPLTTTTNMQPIVTATPLNTNVNNTYIQ